MDNVSWGGPTPPAALRFATRGSRRCRHGIRRLLTEVRYAVLAVQTGAASLTKVAARVNRDVTPLEPAGGEDRDEAANIQTICGGGGAVA